MLRPSRQPRGEDDQSLGEPPPKVQAIGTHPPPTLSDHDRVVLLLRHGMSVLQLEEWKELYKGVLVWDLVEAGRQAMPFYRALGWTETEAFQSVITMTPAARAGAVAAMSLPLRERFWSWSIYIGAHNRGVTVTDPIEMIASTQLGIRQWNEDRDTFAQ